MSLDIAQSMDTTPGPPVNPRAASKEQKYSVKHTLLALCTLIGPQESRHCTSPITLLTASHPLAGTRVRRCVSSLRKTCPRGIWSREIFCFIVACSTRIGQFETSKMAPHSTTNSNGECCELSCLESWDIMLTRQTRRSRAIASRDRARRRTQPYWTKVHKSWIDRTCT